MKLTHNSEYAIFSRICLRKAMLWVIIKTVVNIRSDSSSE